MLQLNSKIISTYLDSSVEIKVNAFGGVELAVSSSLPAEDAILKEAFISPLEHLGAGERTVDLLGVLVFPAVLPHHLTATTT